MAARTDKKIPLRVLSRRAERDNCQSIVFERPAGFHYASGQWLDIRFPDQELATAKTFSFASSPTEPEIVISFRNGISQFKHRLERVEPGDTLILTNYGGGFRLNPRRRALLVAGGIGIAPFRSMIKEAIDTNVHTGLELLYANRSNEFVFYEELEDWRRVFPALTITYVPTQETGRLTSQRIAQLLPDFLDRDIYIVGPPTMVMSVASMFEVLEVPEHRIQTDTFDGY